MQWRRLGTTRVHAETRCLRPHCTKACGAQTDGEERPISHVQLCLHGILFPPAPPAAEAASQLPARRAPQEVAHLPKCGEPVRGAWLDQEDPGGHQREQRAGPDDLHGPVCRHKRHGEDERGDGQPEKGEGAHDDGEQEGPFGVE
eukprot:CAMPEP_0185383068 /NCGR_PEP_ID=MMETSP1364-20130426/56727_1 /TAXON_ID=38817 /ORGANISM="Gephyrocapsa oceanica, Strain RCC1303" /LENGTH=144 /DNA_ID=CAMNT_0027984793 /DNA_START=40 /DNA_END=474 /DNA_ORIENTATION=-